MGLRMKNFNIRASLKNFIFKGGGGVMKNISRELPKKGGLGQFADLRGDWQKKGCSGPNLDLLSI